MAQVWFIFQNNQLLIIDDPHPLITDQTDCFSHFHNAFIRSFSIGSFNNHECYCAELSNDYPLDNLVLPISLRSAIMRLGETWYSVLAKAICLIQWDQNHRYCGRCGEKTMRSPDHFERLCPQCQLAHYPRISPSIIVLIRNGDDLLMTRSPHFTPGAYGLVAGFVEVGETIEEAVHREVMEEVAITISDLQYICSQPWPFPDSLMFGFMANYQSGIITPDPKEIETAGWYRYNDLPGRPSSTISIAHLLIERFIEERRAYHANPTTPI